MRLLNLIYEKGLTELKNNKKTIHKLLSQLIFKILIKDRKKKHVQAYFQYLDRFILKELTLAFFKLISLECPEDPG